LPKLISVDNQLHLRRILDWSNQGGMGDKINIHAKKAGIDRQVKTSVAVYVKGQGGARF
jgi:hypothetical protein